MGSQGEVWADAGLHINEGSFATYAANLKASEGQISEFGCFCISRQKGLLALSALELSYNKILLLWECGGSRMPRLLSLG